MHNKKHIESVIKDFQQGKMVLLTDDNKRENETDLVIAAEYASPDAINFMAKKACGLICLAMASALIDKLNLPPMVVNNSSHLHTNFTVSIDSKEGIRTGISAFDRAKTIADAIREDATFHDFVVPGHIFPLQAKPKGVLERRGHTEGGVDLASLAKLKPAAVICEVMHDNGHMLTGNELKAFALKHSLKIASIDELVHYRLNHDTTILKEITQTAFPTKWGNFKLIAYQTTYDQATHLAVIHGDISTHPALVRIHSECLTGDVLGSLRCDCGNQLNRALEQIAKAPAGILLYLRQEGRGIGLANKLQAYALQDHGLDTVSANQSLGFEPDLRDYGIAVQLLRHLGIQRINLLTNNPDKVKAFDGQDVSVVNRIPLETVPHAKNYNYLNVKKTKMGHLLNLTQYGEKHA
jgi:3,4-dihydroxy 2-butanone 4-phosphate synthase/GTP cyclohydrolase II